MKINKIKTTILVAFALFSLTKLTAQETNDSVRHRFTHLKLEMRAGFDVQHSFSDGGSASLSDTTDYGFNGHYFNLLLGGEFGKGFSYFFRQRIIANAGASTFFDNTDFLYLQYQINDHWAIRAGKEAIANGGFEYDAAPINVYYAGDYWNNYYCFQLAGSVKFTDKSQRHHLTLQVANSPYVHYMGKGNEWKQGLLAYSLLWSGDFGFFKTLYSVNFFERKRGQFVGCVTLGNRFEVGRWSWYIDYMNRVSHTDAIFSSFSVISRMDVAIKHVNLFVKGGTSRTWPTLRGFRRPRTALWQPDSVRRSMDLALNTIRGAVKRFACTLCCIRSTISRFTTEWCRGESSRRRSGSLGILISSVILAKD